MMALAGHKRAREEEEELKPGSEKNALEPSFDEHSCFEDASRLRSLS